MEKVDLNKCLNQSQLEAVTTIEGPVLVIAGAGSGKTRVIEYRALNLVQNSINPNSILLLTFTRRAAREMLSRAARHDPRCENIEGGTFHSFGYKTLKRYARTIGFPDSFSVLDEGDAEEAIHRCASKLGFYDKEKRFPKKNTLRGIISMAINRNTSIEDVLMKDYPHFIEYVPDIEKLRKKYAEYKINSNYLDYDDLLIFLKLLLEDEDIRESLSNRFRFVMVDEYQDTNRLQGDITYLLGMRDRNVMVVGDDAQSIYGFRGASHENIMRFPEKFPECKIIKLEENYRSTQSILDVGNSVMENMENKYSKCLVSARKEAGAKPVLLFFKDVYEEAEYIANEIKSLRDQDIPLRHQGVLFRSEYISIPLQAELSKRNIPYQVFGGLKFYETAHVKDIMAHLKIIRNHKDELSWNRVLMLIEGIGHKSSAQILEAITPCSNYRDVIKKLDKYIQKGYRYSSGLERLRSVLLDVYDQKIDVGEQFGIILDYYTPILRGKYDDWHLRNNDLETLGQIAARYNTLEELLIDFAIEPPERGVLRVEPSTPDEETPLTLSTIHSAKGLEWDVVYIISLVEGVLPVSYSLDSEDEIEEEHRLLYVAVTRAKNRLYLSLHHEGKRGGITQFNKLSRFIDSPNVLSKVERKETLRAKIMGRTYEKEYEEVPEIYDKDSLLKRIIDLIDEKPGE